MINIAHDFFDYDAQANLLPQDGVVHYHGPIMEDKDAAHYYAQLLNTIPWVNDDAVIYGKHITTARKIAWVGDADYAYTYSGTTKRAIAWTSDLRALKLQVEALTAQKFNSCLLNLYHSGKEGMAWHSDDESSLGKDTVIASLSLGAARKFGLRHKVTKEKITLMLEHGSLLVMKGATQTYWQHTIFKSALVDQPRINLTFRTIISENTV